MPSNEGSTGRIAAASGPTRLHINPLGEGSSTLGTGIEAGVMPGPRDWEAPSRISSAAAQQMASVSHMQTQCVWHGEGQETDQPHQRPEGDSETCTTSRLGSVVGMSEHQGKEHISMFLA